MFLKYNWRALCWALFILVLCGIPGSDMPHFNWMEIFSLDKIAHAFVFCILVVLGCIGLAKQYKVQGKRSNVIRPIFLFALVYSPITEFLQDAVFVERTAEMLDMLANWLGCFVGIWIYSRYFANRSVVNGNANT